MPLALSTLGLIGFVAGVRRLTGDARFGLLAGVLLATLGPFYLLADSLQLYSYALFVKGVGFWAIAEAVRGRARHRGRWIALTGLCGFLGVTVCGLETLPALGLFSFLAPLILFDGPLPRRLLVAVILAAACGGGMAAGWAWRLREMAEVLETDMLGALEHLRQSVVNRSAGGLPEMKHGRGYLADVAYRFAMYTPLHLAVIALGLVATFVTRFRRGAPDRWPWTAVGLAFLLAEGPYFLVMRQHVHIHVHTMMHLTFTLAILAASAIWLGHQALSRPPLRNLLLVATGLLFLGATQLLPLAPYGNLRDRAYGKAALARKPRFEALGTVVPENALVVISCKRQDWYLRRLCSSAGRTFVSLNAGATLRPDLLLAAAARQQRPFFVFTEADEKDPIHQRLRVDGRMVAEERRIALFALALFDPETLPPDIRRLPRSQLHDVELVEPAPDDAAVTALKYPLLRKMGSGVVLRLAPPELGGLTEAALPLPLPHHRTARITCILSYSPSRSKRQPELELELAALPGSNDGPSSGHASTLRLRPDGERRRLELPIPPGVRVDGLRFTLRRAAEDSAKSAARILIEGIELTLR